jgi:hypothetical protein
MDIISEGFEEEFVRYYLDYSYPGDPGSGYSFDCDEHGNVDESEMNEAALRNYRACVAGETPTVFRGIQTIEWSYYNHPVGRCSCGAEVVLDQFTNTCHRCGRDYNGRGSLLSDRSQWGEETGESWQDCI